MKHAILTALAALAMVLAAACSNAVLHWSYYPGVFSVLGQFNPYEIQGVRFGASSPGGLVYRFGYTFFADSGNNRVLIWRGSPQNPAPTVVLGQPDDSHFYSNNFGTSAKSLSNPVSVDYDGTYLAVSDRNNNRVLIWDHLPTVNSDPAQYVLGQSDFTSGTAHALNSYHDLDGPGAIALDGGRLAIADTNHNRVLYWASLTNALFDTTAPNIIGQPDDHSAGTNCDASTFNSPYGVTLHSSAAALPSLFVADTLNHRVLRYGLGSLLGNGASADQVWGQNTFGNCSANQGGAAPFAYTESGPVAVFADDSHLLIADPGNFRALMFNNPVYDSTTFGASADRVIGQPFAGVGTQATSTFSATGPNGVFDDGTDVIITDTGHNRFEFWAQPFLDTGLTGVFRQPNIFGKGMNAPPVSDNAFYQNAGIAYDGQHLILADTGNARVLIWNTLPTYNGQSPDVVLGQIDFFHNQPLQSGPNGEHRLNQPRGVASDGTHLVVSDGGDFRVLIWNSFPATNDQGADVVLGQNDFSTVTALPASSSTMQNSKDIAIHNGSLYVTDSNENRVLIWNTIPNSNNKTADAVLGQNDFTAQGAGTSSSALTTPSGIASDDNNVYVADTGNNRVLVFPKSLAGVSQTAAFELGQTDFSGSVNNAGNFSPTANSLSQPTSLSSDGKHLYVIDSGNNRVLMWNLPIAVNQAAAAIVYGQQSFNSGFENFEGLNEKGLRQPQGIAVTGDFIFVSDQGNQRVLVLPR